MGRGPRRAGSSSRGGQPDESRSSPSQRAHRPHELGPRVYRRGRWWAIDLRPWDRGRRTIRDPDAPGWPDRGDRTEDEETARRWSWRYLDRIRQEERGRSLPGLAVQDLQLGEAVGRYLAAADTRLARNTVLSHRTALTHLVHDFGERRPAGSLDRADLQRWVDSWLRDGYRIGTVRTYLLAVGALFQWLEDVGLLELHRGPPSRGVRFPAEPEELARPWEAGELVQIRAAADRMGWRLAVELALGTGARHGELFALRGDDFDRTRRTVRIARQRIRGSGDASPRAPKGRRSRIAVVLPELWGYLPPDPGLLLSSPSTGRAYGLRHTSTILQELLQEAGVYELGASWHRFRHTYARRFLEDGGGIEALQLSLGHRSIRTTESSYGHWLPDRVAQGAAGRIYERSRASLRIVE